MKQDIIINGVSVNELKKQRLAIREGASAIIAENLNVAKSLTQKLIESQDKEEIKALAEKAFDALETVNVVSGVSGITYFLPFYEEYGDNDEILSRKLENSNNQVLEEVWEDGVNKLYSLFEDMESTSRDWNSSNCY